MIIEGFQQLPEARGLEIRLAHHLFPLLFGPGTIAVVAVNIVAVRVARITHDVPPSAEIGNPNLEIRNEYRISGISKQPFRSFVLVSDRDFEIRISRRRRLYVAMV